jgi:putative DNA primase/helicase
MSDTVERARGRWAEILPRLGIDSRFLVNRHGPCPLCGGKDRFRYDDRDGTGSYFCNQCGAGVGIILVRKMHGWDFATACREIDHIIGTDPPRLPSRAPAARPTASRLAKIERTLAQATDREIVRCYLTGRGLSSAPECLLGRRSLAYYGDDGRLVSEFPAMIAPVLGPDGRLQSAHRTYIGDLDPRKKIMPPVETIRGGAVRLFERVDGRLGVSEGIETAIAAYELFGVSTWAALSTAGMESFEPPAGLHHLIVFADHDSNFAGQRAAYALAAKWQRTLDLVEVRVPPESDSDWLDVLNQQRMVRTA